MSWSVPHILPLTPMFPHQLFRHVTVFWGVLVFVLFFSALELNSNRTFIDFLLPLSVLPDALVNLLVYNSALCFCLSVTNSLWWAELPQVDVHHCLSVHSEELGLTSGPALYVASNCNVD